MKALISPNEKVNVHTIDGIQEFSSRIAQISEQAFDIASPLFWVDCDDSVGTETHYYDAQSSSFIALPSWKEEESTVTTGAQNL